MGSQVDSPTDRHRRSKGMLDARYRDLQKLDRKKRKQKYIRRLYRLEDTSYDKSRLLAKRRLHSVFVTMRHPEFV